MKRAVFLLLLIVWVAYTKALVPPLEREINLSLNNESVKAALEKIQGQTGLVFSYRNSIIDNVAPVTLQLKQKTVREALALMLPKNILFKQKSNYIILKERPLEQNPKKLEVNGYVIDKATEKKVPNVTIYDKTTLKSVTTDEYGYYSITVPNENQCIKVNKENYEDTCVSIGQPGSITNIAINPLSDARRARDSANWRYRLKSFSNTTNNLFKRFKGYVNTRNVNDSLYRGTQVSFLPFLGSNGLMSGNVYNNYSFNVFGGYSRGNRVLELGGFFNINKEKMKGIQAAGFFNLVGDSVKGVQLAGFFNITGRHVSGYQNAGFFNFNLGTSKGFQGAGFLNFNVGNVRGFQSSGFVNLNFGSFKGLGLAGFVNFTRYSVEGVQLAGMLNIIGDTLNGSCLSGFTNLTWYSRKSLEVSGMLNHAQFAKENTQVAGFMNITAKGSTKVQVSPLINIADKLTGCQIGVLNYSDSASGVPIGLLSLVKHGVHQFELSTDEIFRAGISFRTGVHKFHNIFNLAFHNFSSSPLWYMGYGVGTSFKVKPKLRLDLSATANHVSQGSLYHATSELYKFYMGLEYKLFNKFTIAAGPTFNLYWSDKLMPDYGRTYNAIVPYHSYNYELENGFNLKGWYGFRASLRFL